MDCILRTILDTVHAEVAFSDTQCCMGIASTVTVIEAFLAVGTEFDIAPYAEKWLEGKQSEERAKGTDCTAPESWQEPVCKYHRNENQSYKCSAVEERLL